MRQLNGAPQLEPAQTMVAINKVTMSFGEFTAVRDVDIQVGDGEFLAIVGPTGCGKSTILNSVAGLLKPSSGEVAIDGRAVSGVQESVGYLFQQDALLPWKTAYQNVELGLRFRGVPEAERKEAILSAMADYLGPEAMNPIAFYLSDMAAEEWTRGAYATSYDLGGLHRWGHLQNQPTGPIHYACSDIAAEGYQHVDGAVRIGESVAKSIIEGL